MRGGLLRKRVTFERRVRTSDSGGGGAITWSTLATVWGGYTPERGIERLDAGRLQGETMGILRVRSSDTVDAITVADRVLIDSVSHQIRSITQPDQRGKALEMVVERGVPT